MKRTSLIALLLAAVPFTGCSQESKTNQAPTASVTNSPPAAAKETYRDLKREDGIQFGAYVDSMAFSFGGPASGTLKRFGLVESGKLIDLELVDTNFTGGVIKTKKFGDIHAKSSGPSSMSYAVTETQIKKLREFLAEEKKKRDYALGKSRSRARFRA